MKTIYHVFTHNTDEWLDTEKEARAMFAQFVIDCGCARLYEEQRDDNDELIDENCIESEGEYPM